MAASAAARAILLSRATAALPLKPNLPPPHSLFIRPKKRVSAITCLFSGVDGGGVSDEFVSTRKSTFSREFSVLANILKTIEPLDNSVISKGVSDSAKDSMKQTISTMLGLLPSDQFTVTVRVSKSPLDRLIVSSIATGYTLWNAEYRISLMRNFDLSMDGGSRLGVTEIGGVSEVSDSGGTEVGGGVGCVEELSMTNQLKLEDLSSDTLIYIKRLELELAEAKQDLQACRQENLQMEHIRNNNNDLLDYLRSLEPEMVKELSSPSSTEVEEIMQQLAQNILQRFFKDQIVSDNTGDSASSSIQNHQDVYDELCDTVGTPRDYLAKLLFWCMLLGHHLRGLENRLHLSCAVGLL